jgi:hypothetical protein
MASSYTLNFSDPNKTNSITITGPVRDNFSTSLDLVGPGYVSYGTAIAQDFLKLLENFASPNPPVNPIEGQLWYDTSNPGRKVLRVNNGAVTSARWPSANGIYQQANDPSTEYSQNLIDGDMWVDTGNSQLKIRYGEDWTLVGPNISTGANKTGSESVNLVSNTNETYPVILNWVNGKVVEIISYNSFTPRTVIDGFPSLNPGINITTRVAAKYNGLADRAKVLEISNGVYVQASEVLKNIWPASLRQTHAGSLIIESNLGLYIKRPNQPNKEIKISVTTSSNLARVEYLYPQGSLEVGIRDRSYIIFDGENKNVAINTNTVPGTALTVFGSASFKNNITITTSSSTTVGLTLEGSANISGNTTIAGKLNVTGVTTLSNFVTVAKDIIPSTGIVMLGSEAMPFDRIYVNSIGTTTTNFYGRITEAHKLVTLRTFQVAGHVTTSTPVSFDGTSNVTISTRLSSTAITDQTSLTTATSTTTMIVTDSGSLSKITKGNFLADVYPNLISTGMIMAYATSATTATITAGWLYCNGATHTKTGTYTNLFQIIGTQYGGDLTTFNIPDMRNVTTATGGYPIYYHIKT